MKKYIILLPVAIILIGIVAAFCNHIEVNNITGLLFTYKSIYLSLFLIIILFLISLTGIPSYSLYLLLDLFFMGELLYLFISNFSYKGFLYLIVYFIVFKIPLYFLLILNSFYTLKYGKNLYKFIFNKWGISIHNIKLYFKKILVINIIIYFIFLFKIIFISKLMTLLGTYLKL